MEITIPYYFDQIGIRLSRFIRHLLFPFSKARLNDFPPANYLEWLADFWFYSMDILGIPEIYQAFMQLLKWNTRKLYPEEIKIARLVFGDSINTDLVRIDDTARFGTKKIAAAYVSFNTINYNKKIKKQIFVHELVHIWQFQSFGSIYIARAIKAQKSKEGYDYGGVAFLYQHMLKIGSLKDFNFEQQADIIEDYYGILSKPEKAAPMFLSVYQYYADQLQRCDQVV